MRFRQITILSICFSAFGLSPGLAIAAQFSDQDIEAYYARRDYRGALQYEQAWVAAQPGNPDAYFNLGGTLALQFQDYPAAINAFRRSLADDPGYAPSWQGLGSAYMRLHEYRNAADAYKHSAQLTPMKPLPWLNLSAALSFAGDDKASVQALWDGMRYAGSNFNSAMWFHYAEALRNMNQTRQSIDVYKNALQLDPNNGAAWNDMGTVYGELGQYATAQQCYEKAARLGVALARENLATIHNMMQQYSASVRAANPHNSAYARAMAEHNHDLLFYGRDVLRGDKP